MSTSPLPHSSGALQPGPSRWLLIPAMLGAGILTDCAFRPLNWHLVAWLCLVPPLLLTRGRHDRAVFWYGTLWGWAYFSCTFLFLRDIFFACPFLVALIWAPLAGLWLYAAQNLWRKFAFPDPRIPQMTAPPARWVLPLPRLLAWICAVTLWWWAFEWLRTWLFTGLPWNTLAISQAAVAPTRICAAAIGELGLSGLIALVNVAAAAALLNFLHARRAALPYSRLSLLPLALAIAATAAMIPIGRLAATSTASATTSLRVGVVQGHFMPYFHQLSAEDYSLHLNTYAELTLACAKDRPDLVLWPETPLPMAYQNDENARSLLAYLSREIKVPLIVGTGWTDPAPDESKPSLLYNAALLYHQEKIISVYRKMHCVPYGEYMPFRYLMSEPLFAKADAIRQMGPSLSEGRHADLFQLPQGLRAGVHICFEDVFSDGGRRFADAGADLFVTITNDSWFGLSSGGAAHSDHAVLRSIEYGLPSIRCGNTCESMLILPDGSIPFILKAADGSRFHRGQAVIEVPVARETGAHTFFYRHGQLLYGLLAALAGLATLLFFVKILRDRHILAQSTLPPEDASSLPS